MDTQQTKFDWNVWYASIPGIPAGWGKQPFAESAPALEDGQLAALDIPLLEAA